MTTENEMIRLEGLRALKQKAEKGINSAIENYREGIISLDSLTENLNANNETLKMLQKEIYVIASSFSPKTDTDFPELD